MVGASLAFVTLLYLSVVDVWVVRGGWHGAALLAACLIVAVLWILKHNPSFKDRELGKPKPKSHLLDDIERAAQYVQQKYSREAIAYFQNVLSDLASYLVRVDQEVEVDGRELWTCTKLLFRYEQPADVNLSASSEVVSGSTGESRSAKEVYECTLLPIVTARKGLMFDRFGAYSQSGTPLSLLSQYEVRGLIAATIQALFTQHLNVAGTAPDLSPDQRGVLQEVIDDVLANAVCFIGNTPAVETPEFKARDLRKAALASIENRLQIWPTLFDQPTRTRITQVCKVLTYNYVIVAEIPKPSTRNFLVRYEHQVTSDLMNHSSEEHLRARLGLDPVMIDVPVSRALQADSFHLQVKAPPNQYVFDHHLEKLGSSEPMRQANFSEVQPKPPYVRLYHAENRSIGHLYVRRQGTHPNPLLASGADAQVPTTISVDHPAPVPSFKSVMRFREIPPGSLASVALLSVLTTILVSFFAISQAGLTGTGFQGAPALILALPAFLAAGLGRGIDGKGLARSSLSVSVALFFVCLNSLVSVLLYVLGSVQKLHGEVHVTLSPPFDFVVLHSNGWWLGLMAWSWATTICVYREKRAQTSYYLKRLKRSAIDNEKRSLQNEEDSN